MKRLQTPLYECFRACAVTLHGRRWGCGVSDDTGGVIPTSASNLQHEKDTLVTPIPAPYHPLPPFPPSTLSLSLSVFPSLSSFEPKSTSVSDY